MARNDSLFLARDETLGGGASPRAGRRVGREIERYRPLPSIMDLPQPGQTAGATVATVPPEPPVVHPIEPSAGEATGGVGADVGGGMGSDATGTGAGGTSGTGSTGSPGDSSTGSADGTAFHDGGYVAKAVKAKLKGGEYVLRAEAVKRIGLDALERMNAGEGGA